MDRPHRIALEGGTWDGIVVVEVTPTGLLLETAAEPVLPIGTVRFLEIDGLRGCAIAEATYPHPDDAKRFYAIKVIEFDEGLLAAIAGRTTGGDCVLRVTVEQNE